jgi:hypothetical protein
MQDHHLYVISEGEAGPVKIGRSISAPSRLCSLQTGNPRPLRILAAWEVRADEINEAESTLHEELEGFALIGEWFALSERFILDYMPDYFGANGYSVRRAI